MLWFAQGSATLFSPVAELRGHERQAAKELGQWKTGVEEPAMPWPPAGDRGWMA
jgi:hypothetical protein